MTRVAPSDVVLHLTELRHEKGVRQMAEDVDEWAKEFEVKLAKLAPDMQATQALLEQEGFRVDSGNKSFTGWYLTAYDENMNRGSVKVESDGTKITVTRP
jgi:hypothetical protein